MKSPGEWTKNLDRARLFAERDLEWVWNGDVPDLDELQLRLQSLQECFGCFATFVRGYLQLLFDHKMISKEDAALVHFAVAEPHWDKQHLPSWVTRSYKAERMYAASVSW